jgi:trigger factor
MADISTRRLEPPRFVEESQVTMVKDEGPFERILTMTIDEVAIEESKKTAARRLARDIDVKGFRRGKAPLKVVESTVGSATLRREAIDDALPKLLTAAIEEAGLEPAVMPRLQELRDEGDGVEADVLVTLWPSIDTLPRYRERTVEIDAPPVDSAAVDEQIERMRNQFADLEDVDREAFDGDFAVVDVTTTKDGEEFAAGSATDMLFEVGAGMFLEGMDEALRGSGAGAILEFDSTLPPAFGDGGADVSVRVLVKQVKAKQLPELTDEWVEDMTEFESVDEMRAELEAQMIRVRAAGLRNEFERALLDLLIEELELELPQALVAAEMEGVFHRFAHRLEQQGIEFAQYLQLTGQEEQAFVADLEQQAGLNLKTRLLLEAVAAAEDLEVSDDEIDETVVGLAAANGMSVDEYRTALAEGAQESALTGDILRRKAVDRLLELAVPVDGDGMEIDIPAPEGAADEADGDEAGDDADTDETEDEADRPTNDGLEPAEEE